MRPEFPRASFRGVARNLAGIECRYREHLIDSDGFCHRVHHALKAALQFLIPGTVHHLYDVVILSGNQRFDSGDWSQAKARQHQVLIVPASGGKDCDCIYSLRLVHERESERSGTGGELYADARRKTILCSKRGVDHPSSDLNSVVTMGTERAQCFQELFLAKQSLRQARDAVPGQGVNSHTTGKTIAGMSQHMPGVEVYWVRVCITPIVGFELRPSAIVKESSSAKRSYLV